MIAILQVTHTRVHFPILTYADALIIHVHIPGRCDSTRYLQELAGILWYTWVRQN